MIFSEVRETLIQKQKNKNKKKNKKIGLDKIKRKKENCIDFSNREKRGIKGEWNKDRKNKH